MDVIHPRCAGLDISKKDAKVCVRIVGSGRRRATETVTTWGSTTNQILALRGHLASEQVTCVVMEATGDYWKPFYYLLEDLEGVEVMLVNAREAKNLPGRKTDVADASWLAQLGAHGLVRASFVPPQPIRELRDLTRTRTAITGNARVRCSDWRSYSRTPASNCPWWPPTSSGSPGGRCSRPWPRANATHGCWPTWPRSGCAPRPPSSSKR